MKSNLSLILAIQTSLIMMGALLYLKDPSHQLVWFVVLGGVISGSQFGLLYFIWWRIFYKKKIAPSVITVVIKYALLGLTLWYLNPLEQNQIQALFIGVLTGPISLVLFALIKKSK